MSGDEILQVGTDASLQIVFLIFVLGSHLFAFTIAMNRITGHATCTIVWGVVGLVACFMLSIPRMLKNVSYLSIGGKL